MLERLIASHSHGTANVYFSINIFLIVNTLMCTAGLVLQGRLRILSRIHVNNVPSSALVKNSTSMSYVRQNATFTSRFFYLVCDKKYPTFRFVLCLYSVGCILRIFFSLSIMFSATFFSMCDIFRSSTSYHHELLYINFFYLWQMRHRKTNTIIKILFINFCVSKSISVTNLLCFQIKHNRNNQQ